MYKNLSTKQSTDGCQTFTLFQFSVIKVEKKTSKPGENFQTISFFLRGYLRLYLDKSENVGHAVLELQRKKQFNVREKLSTIADVPTMTGLRDTTVV